MIGWTISPGRGVLPLIAEWEPGRAEPRQHAGGKGVAGQTFGVTVHTSLADPFYRQNHLGQDGFEGPARKFMAPPHGNLFGWRTNNFVELLLHESIPNR
jgi:hypothetical protein